MAIGDSIQQYPLLRLFVPYACGVVIGDFLYPSIPLLTSTAVMACVVVVIAMVGVYMVCSVPWRIVYGGLALIQFLVLGGVCSSLSRERFGYYAPSV